MNDLRDDLRTMVAARDGHARAKERADQALRLFDSTERALAIARLAASSLVGDGLGKELINAAGEAMELARARLVAARKKEEKRLRKRYLVARTPSRALLRKNVFGGDYGGPSMEPLVLALPSARAAPSTVSSVTAAPSWTNADQGKREESGEEETLYEVIARILKRVGSDWAKCGVGFLRLHRRGRASRMVIRDDIGRVLFNVPISRGMTFHKVIKETRKGELTFVQFEVIEDADRGGHTFLLQVKPELVDGLHEALECSRGVDINSIDWY